MTEPRRPRRKPWERWRVLSWMASLSAATGQMTAAQGYLLELLAIVAFSEHEPRTADDV